MSATAWLIRLGSAAQARPFYLRRTFDGALTWSSDLGAADPAPTRVEAEKRAARSISGTFHAVEVDAALCRPVPDPAATAAAARRHRKAVAGEERRNGRRTRAERAIGALGHAFA